LGRRAQAKKTPGIGKGRRVIKETSKRKAVDIAPVVTEIVND